MTLLNRRSDGWKMRYLGFETSVIYQALPNNPKIRVTPDRKFVFKPRYDIRTRQDLYQLLKRHELKGLGGVYLDDIAECIPDAEKVINVSFDH